MNPNTDGGPSRRWSLLFLRYHAPDGGVHIPFLTASVPHPRVLNGPCGERACFPSFLSCRFQRDETPWPIPSRLSTSFAVIPGSETIRTASNLNSLSYLLGIDTPPVSFYNFALRCVHYFENLQTFPLCPRKNLIKKKSCVPAMSFL